MITDAFDLSSPMMSPENFYGPQLHLCEICLVTFSEVIFRTLLERYPCSELAVMQMANGRRSIFAFNYKGVRLAFYLSGIGASAAATDVIEVNWRCGATKFILFGSAGSLMPEQTEGRFVVPTEAYRDEGMSYHYAPPSDYIKVRMADVVKSFFESRNLPYTAGRIWTTDAFYRETLEQVRRRRDEQCIAVEMEIAGVQAVCDFHGFELYPFLVTGDILDGDEYDPQGLNSANHDTEKLSVALDLAVYAGTRQTG